MMLGICTVRLGADLELRKARKNDKKERRSEGKTAARKQNNRPANPCTKGLCLVDQREAGEAGEVGGGRWEVVGGGTKGRQGRKYGERRNMANRGRTGCENVGHQNGSCCTVRSTEYIRRTYGGQGSVLAWTRWIMRCNVLRMYVLRMYQVLRAPGQWRKRMKSILGMTAKKPKLPFDRKHRKQNGNRLSRRSDLLSIPSIIRCVTDS
jgi:hypothetical protein